MQILLFEAVWCKDCLAMKPLWRNLKVEMPKLDLTHLDVDVESTVELSRKYNIEILPVAIFLDKDENELERVSGIRHRDDVISLINKYKNL